METQIENQTLEQAVAKVVKWWTNKSFRTPLNQNNGDNSEHGFLAFMLMNMSSSKAQESVTEEKIQLFEQKLTEILLAAPNSYRRTLDVDYNPCVELAEAAEYAGLDSGCFPCKSVTWISESNKATAKYQYGGQVVTL